MSADYEVIDRINELLNSTDPETTNTSMRIPKALREAASLAVKELGVAPSATVLTANALRAMLQGTVMLAVLDRHYEEYPLSTATSPPSTDLIRLRQTPDLRQRPAPTLLPLVHTEEIREVGICPLPGGRRETGSRDH